MLLVAKMGIDIPEQPDQNSRWLTIIQKEKQIKHNQQSNLQK